LHGPEFHQGPQELRLSSRLAPALCCSSAGQGHTLRCPVTLSLCHSCCKANPGFCCKVEKSGYLVRALLVPRSFYSSVSHPLLPSRGHFVTASSSLCLLPTPLGSHSKRSFPQSLGAFQTHCGYLQRRGNHISHF